MFQSKFARTQHGLGWLVVVLVLGLELAAPDASLAQSQPPGFGPPRGENQGPQGPRGMGPGSAPERKLLEKYDADGNGRLNQEERAQAREEAQQTQRRGPGGPPGFGRGGGNNPPGEPRPGGPPGGPGGRGRGPRVEPATPGRPLTPDEVTTYSDEELFDPAVIRTLFLTFENEDWEQELEVFRDTDVDVPAKLMVDGQTFAEVGVHFRGASSYFMVPRGSKRSLNISIDHADAEARLLGSKTLNLLNANGDPSMLSTILYSQMIRQHLPAPQANLVRVVINNESWGLYVNTQQFDRLFVESEFGGQKGRRWKVSGSPNGDGGLSYVGDDVAEYRRRYEIKTKDEPEAWEDLISLCRTLSETPIDQLPEAIEPILDVEGALWFLAYDVALVNSDGYWVRASDYSIFQDEEGKFHVVPHDMNEAFKSGGGGPGFGPPPGGPGRGPGGFGAPDGPGRPPEGFGPPAGFGPPPEFGPPPGDFGPPPEGFGPPAAEQPPQDAPARRPDRDPNAPEAGRGPRQGRGPQGRGGPGGGPGMREGGITLDPLVALDDPRKPLRSRLLQVPEYRRRYLEHLRTIAEQDLNWERLGPIVADFRSRMEEDVRLDTKKLSSFESFQLATSDQVDRLDPAPEATPDSSPRPPRGTNPEPGLGAGPPPTSPSLRGFVEGRRKFLLEHEAIRSLGNEDSESSSP